MKRMGTRTREITRSKRKQKISSIQTSSPGSRDVIMDMYIVDSDDDYDWDPENGIMEIMLEEEYLSEVDTEVSFS